MMARASQGGTRGVEDELKFELTAAQVGKLCRAPHFRAMQSARPRVKTLRATYYDTPDFELAARTVSLRVRKESRHYVQCFKAQAEDATSAGFARHEWEWRVPGPALDASLLRADDAVLALLGGVSLSDLAPIYTAEMKRQSRELHTPGGAVIFCEIDQGRVFSGDAETAVYELELELKSGDVGELLRLADFITDIVPARLSSRTKAYRGYTLVQGNAHPWVGAQQPHLAKKASAEDVLRTSIVEGLKHLIANEDCVLARSHIEGVHQMRVALRRMRSLITTYKNLLPKGSYEDLSQGLKDAGNQLGAARDWDVFLDEILRAVETGAAEVGFEKNPSLTHLRARAEQRQAQAYLQADALINSPRYAALLTDVLLWAGVAPWRDMVADQPCGTGKTSNTLDTPATNVAKAILAKRHRRLVKAGKGLATLTIEQRHALRIASKKARYASQFFSALYPSKATKPYICALKRVQESLGHLNDLATAERLMADLATTERGAGARTLSHAAGVVEGWYMHAHAQNEDDLAKAWERFNKAKTFW